MRGEKCIGCLNILQEYFIRIKKHLIYFYCFLEHLYRTLACIHHPFNRDQHTRVIDILIMVD